MNCLILTCNYMIIHSIKVIKLIYIYRDEFWFRTCVTPHFPFPFKCVVLFFQVFNFSSIALFSCNVFLLFSPPLCLYVGCLPLAFFSCRLTGLYRAMVAGLDIMRNIVVRVLEAKWYTDVWYSLVLILSFHMETLKIIA